MMRNTGPLVHTLAGTWIPCLLLTAGLGIAGAGIMPGSWSAAFMAFTFGFWYTQCFEYAYHRFPMHQLRWSVFTGIRVAHTDHHRAFPRSRFFIRPQMLSGRFMRTDGTAAAMNDMIAQRWWIYPVLFVIHAAAGIVIIAPETLNIFLLGTAVHYSVFELAHWFTHVRPSRPDTFLRRIPLIGKLWAYTVDFHRTHHSYPQTDFNFTPPFLGDILGRTWLTRRWE